MASFVIRGRGGSGTVFTMPAGIGPLELVIVLVIVLVIFGPKRLPGLGKQVGNGMREFKEAITGNKGDDDDEAERRPALTAAEAEPAPSTPVKDSERA
jgi:sec-independent protein translocase protein TatA